MAGRAQHQREHARRGSGIDNVTFGVGLFIIYIVMKLALS